MILYQCEDGDFEGDLAGAMRHCDHTGHTLTRTHTDGTVLTVSLDPGEDP